MTTSLRRLAPLLLALPLLAACGTSDPYKLPYDKLELALVHLDTGHEQDAAAELEDLLAHTQAEPERFGLQRFYANYLLARAHVRAFRSGRLFLDEEVPVDPSLEIMGGAQSVRPSPHAHLMASLLHMHDAVEQLAVERGAAREVVLEDGTERPLLPEALMDFPVADVGLYLSLARLSALGELGFLDKVREIADVPELSTIEGCEALLTRARVAPDAWDELFVFQFRANEPVDRVLAFQFAVRALQQASRGDGTYDLDDRTYAEIVAFMESGFLCSKCQSTVSGGLLHCPIDNAPYIDHVVDAPRSGNGNGGA